MKSSKKLLAILLVITMLIAHFTWVNFNNDVYAVEAQTVATKYFYNQLTSSAKVFYNAMETMLANGKLKTGTASYEFSDSEISQDQLAAFAVGKSNKIMEDFGAARDAFSQDHPEVFYVDYDQFSIRVTQNNDGYKVAIGTGRSDSYLNKGFKSVTDVESAISTVNSGVNAIVNHVTSEEFVNGIEDGQNLREEQIKYVHNKIIELTDYRLELAVTKTEYAYNIRTVYGVFGNGEAVCEGFARTVKMVLDKLNIPCVLVRGVYINNAITPE